MSKLQSLPQNAIVEDLIHQEYNLPWMTRKNAFINITKHYFRFMHASIYKEIEEITPKDMWGKKPCHNYLDGALSHRRSKILLREGLPRNF